MKKLRQELVLITGMSGSGKSVALHALDGLQCSFAADRDALLDFTDSLWSADGGFHGNWTDDALDVEYTYYGLLALGHLAF